MSNYSIRELIDKGDFVCTACGKVHSAKLTDVIIGENAINSLVPSIKRLGGTKVFVLDDENTKPIAGTKVCELIKNAGLPYVEYTMSKERIEPDEKAIGSIVMHFDRSCDILVTVGSGVLNDLGKILAFNAKLPYIVVGTAPSMDGYASNTSAVIRDGLKQSLNDKNPDIVIGDTDIVVTAPKKMKAAGIGDMIAKYISICEWRISALLNGEFYCADTADMILVALKKCVDALQYGIESKQAAEAIMEGLVLSGIGANYVGISRPVSGMEHYFSHIWDMRNAEFGTPNDFHGIQCGIGTYDVLKIYEKIKTITPNREKALAYVKAFDYSKWCVYLRECLGNGAEAMIENEAKEHKYDVALHSERLDRIIANWDKIIEIANTLPSSESIKNMLQSIGAPISPLEIGLTKKEERMAFVLTKDIRDKYIGSRLLWDIGELDAVADELFGNE